LQALEKITYSNNWITIVLLLLFLSIVFLKILDAKKLKESFFAFFNFIEDDDTEVTPFFNGFQRIIFLFSISVLSLLGYYFKLYKYPSVTESFTTYFSIFLVFFCYFFVKRILEFLLIRLFLIEKAVRTFLFSKNNYLYSVSFLIYIGLILITYTQIPINYVFYFSAFLFLLRFIFYVVRNKKLVFNKLFYFILYICAFEIATLFILFKLLF
jgi:hypothetical protein